MNDTFKQAQADLESLQSTKDLLVKQSEAIKAQIKAKDKQIKAQEELIEALIGNTEQKAG